MKRSGKVRRAKLYYLRNLSGKAVRLKERFNTGKATAEEQKAAKVEKLRKRSANRTAKLEKKAANKAAAQSAKSE